MSSPSSEAQEQAALLDWVYTLEGRYPALCRLFATPNAGKRAPWRVRREGIRAGVPDLLLPVPSHDGRHVGLALELKYGRNRATVDQAEWLGDLETYGWRAELVVFKAPGDWIAAAQIIAEHLALPKEVAPWPG